METTEPSDINDGFETFYEICGVYDSLEKAESARDTHPRRNNFRYNFSIESQEVQ